MSLILRWSGPYTFSSRRGTSVLDAPEADCGGIYVWGARTTKGLLPHYVGESGNSIAQRHFKHFQDYASGIYNVRNADAFLCGTEEVLHEGPLWRKDAWREVGPFIDDFPHLVGHVDRTLAAIEIYLAPLDAEQRIRRRIEGALVAAFDGLPREALGLFGDGYRKWKRRDDEVPVEVVSESPPPIIGFPVRVEA